jgi:probable HAF family extracellular repeat protein
MDDLGTLGGNWGLAEAINNAGQIVGSGDIGPGQYRGFLKNPGEPMQALPILDKFLTIIICTFWDSAVYTHCQKIFLLYPSP